MKTFFATTLKHGPRWDAARGLRQQNQWTEHAALMDRWTAEGLIVFGGPLPDSDRVLLVFDLPDEGAIRRRLAEDPWHQSGLLEIVAIERWTVLLDRTEGA